jgi:hypothetical protein
MGRNRIFNDEQRRERRNANTRKWALANPERAKALHKKSCDKNREKIRARSREHMRKLRKERPELIRAWKRADYLRAKERYPDRIKIRNRIANRKKSNNPITTAEVREGICPICLKQRKLVPDHDHSDGQMRDWICKICNLQLGNFEHPLRNKTFTEYMQKWLTLKYEVA